MSASPSPTQPFRAAVVPTASPPSSTPPSTSNVATALTTPLILTFHPSKPSAPSNGNTSPFNAGPRVCIGQEFAKTEMAYTIVRIVQRFERCERLWTEEEGVG
ncbi:MAG: hypothetical protein Q9208_006468 [Pyrenodesmia sp. 3 TL-2023]